MELSKLQATTRTTRGKGHARRLRDAGQIPATAYGAQMEPMSLSVSPGVLRHSLQGEYGVNTVFELEVEGGSFPAILADYQYHPVSRELLHADFKRIELDKAVEVDVPFELYGKSRGVTAGGTLQQVYRALRVRALPLNIPIKITYDITKVELDEVVTAGDIKLPEGVSLVLPPQRTVAGVYAAKHRTKEEEEAEAAEKKPGS